MDDSILSVAEAKSRILSSVFAQPSESCPVTSCFGRILAEAVHSPVNLPRFDNSAMDGYALQHQVTDSASPDNPVALDISGIIAAGDTVPAAPLASHQTMQIFTGAMIPRGADAVIRQEDVEITGHKLVIRRPVKPGENIRRAGEEISSGEVVLHAGRRITPATVSLLASLGIAHVLVSRQPAVAILTTGSELTDISDASAFGRIPDSNTSTLQAALAELHLSAVCSIRCSDDRGLLLAHIQQSLEHADTLLITGGVSVGKFDYVKELVEQAGFQPVFWRIKQKPGKPLYLAVRPDDQKIIFGLPGNPASVLVCFYQYVRPALLKAMGAAVTALPVITAPAASAYTKSSGITHFLKSHLDASGSVTFLNRQGSHMMSSFSEANCLAVLPEETTEINPGDMVEIHLLPI